jgi:hypothetical protein
MANTFTKILSDTKTHAKVLLSFDNDSTTTAAAVDASALSDTQTEQNYI